ncbi:MAG: hypothetical protein PHE62_09785 [Acidobacteriota bacterium]|nr:hypothetical protein [Acidobacteriota bacterium]
MKERKYFCLSIVMLFLVKASAVASEDENIQITALLFKSDPTIVTVVSGGSDGKGHIIGTQVGGVVTSQFPDSIVLFKLQGADQFDKDAIPALIKRNFKFQCGSELVQGLPTVWFEQDAFSGRGGTFSKTVGDRLLADAVDFGLYCLSLREDAWIFKARFTMRSSAGSYSPDQQTVLLDEIIGLRPAEPILIGFPHTDSKKGKTIYWVALLLEKE